MNVAKPGRSRNAEHHADLRDEGATLPAAIVHPDRHSPCLDAAIRDTGREVRFNERAQCIEVRDLARFDFESDAPEWQRLGDRTEAMMREAVAMTAMVAGKDGPERMRYTDSLWRLTFQALLGHSAADPFDEWLMALPPWDGVSRLATVFGDCFETPDTALARWAARYIFCGAILRARRPGAKLDTLPILVGPQNVGKSTWVREVLPPEHQAEWFADGLNLSAERKVLVEALDGRVLVEVSELAGARRADVPALKAFLTATDDGSIRRAYGRYTSPAPRRCVLVGTANPGAILPNDETGMRRFAPIETPTGSDIERYMTANRDQLWKEALSLFEQMHDPQADIRMPVSRDDPVCREAADNAEAYRNVDEVLEADVAGVELPEGGAPMRWILERLAIPPERIHDRPLVTRVGQALAHRGAKRRRLTRDGRWEWLYFD